MSTLAAAPSVVRALTKDRLALALAGVTWLSALVVLAIVSTPEAEQADGSPILFAPVALMMLFGWRTRAVAEGLGFSRQEAKAATWLVVVALSLAITAVLIGGQGLWTAIT